MGMFRVLMLRAAAARLRGDDDVIRHAATYQRLSESLQRGPSDQMMPVPLRTLFRSARTRAATQIRPDWVWPYWIEQQLDPGSPSFVPRGQLPFAANITHRNWTTVGNPEFPGKAIVDPAGLVTPWLDGWSLDWWVGTREGWRFPSRERELRQTLVDHVPVVETVMPVGGGEAVQRVFAVSEDQNLVVAEVENRTAHRIEVAFALRPYNPEGLAVVRQIELRGHTVMTDGRPAVFLPDAPTRFLVSSFAHGDTARLVDKGRLAAEPGTIKDPEGLLQAASIYDVGPGQSVRVAMPLEVRGRTRTMAIGRQRLSRASATPAPAPDVSVLRRARSVASEWGDRLRKEGMQVELPDAKLQAAVDANRASLLLFHEGEEITSGPFTYRGFWFRDAAYQLAALDRWGFHREAERVLRSYPDRQRRSGSFTDGAKEWDAAGAAIWTIAEHHRFTNDPDFVEELAPSVRQATRWLSRKLAARSRAGVGFRGLLPAGIAPDHLGPFDVYYWDDFWALRGLRDAAELFRLAVRPDNGTPQSPETAKAARAARAADATADRLQKALFESIERTALKLGRRIIPAGPRRGVDAGMVANLVAVWPLHLLAPTNPWVVVSLDAIRQEFMVGDALFQGASQTGLSTYLTLQLAFAELESGDPSAWERLQWMLDVATPTFTWPEAIHPNLGTGCSGDGHLGWASAEFLSFVRNVLVRETTEGALALMSLLPPGWEGRDVHVRDAPTHQGKISFELEWRDDTPRLSWECERPGVLLKAPGLDPDWSSEERSGEATLLPVDLSHGAGAGPFVGSRRKRRRVPRLSP
ncbi:MAG TPA: hypothetical protein VF660_08785 [Actinomycetota bacterium]